MILSPQNSAAHVLQVAGDPTLSTQLSKFMGVRNGIDVDIWDPATDTSLPRCFGADDLVGGKAACREALRQRLGLTGWGDKPLVGVVSRLTAQKGACCSCSEDESGRSFLQVWEIDLHPGDCVCLICCDRARGLQHLLPHSALPPGQKL